MNFTIKIIELVAIIVFTISVFVILALIRHYCCGNISNINNNTIINTIDNENVKITISDESDSSEWMTSVFTNTKKNNGEDSTVTVNNVTDVTNITNEYCSICSDSLNDGCIMTRCYHKFHYNCIKNWELTCKKKKTPFLCPICSHNLYQQLKLIVDND